MGWTEFVNKNSVLKKMVEKLEHSERRERVDRPSRRPRKLVSSDESDKSVKINSEKPQLSTSNKATKPSSE